MTARLPGRIALLVALGVAGCGEADRAASPASGVEEAVAPSSGEPNAATASPANQAAPVEAASAGKAGGTATADQVAPADRSGPTRQARCRIDGEPVETCRFTPLFGDGSFNIALAGDHEYRLIVDGERGHVFVVFGPEHRVPLAPVYHRDRADRACWVSDEPGHQPGRICVY